MAPHKAGPARAQAVDTEVRFFNRDLSWLEFNRRVLAQAADRRVPLLDRSRFLSIFTSNLDEFYMKRVGLVKRQVHAGIDGAQHDGLTPRQQLSRIRELAAELQAEAARIWAEELRPTLASEGVHVLRWSELSPRERDWANDWHEQNVFPALTPLAVDPAHRFPFISNLSDNLAILAQDPRDAETAQSDRATGDRGAEMQHARLKIPNIRRFVRLPGSTDRECRFVLLRDIIRSQLGNLFPGMVIHEQAAFRVTRSAGIQKDDLEAHNVLQSVEADLKQRKFARAVRVEVEEGASSTLSRWLQDNLNLDPQDVYTTPSDADFPAMAELADLDRPDLKEPVWKPVVPHRLASESAGDRTPANFFAAVRRQDILVHHPYESFSASVERFIAAAAADPDVVAIKQTLYRTSPDSPFIEHLVRAAEQGKQVACLVELRARFDEGRNVRFARQLEKAGVHVAYGVLGLKTHCKTSLVVRRESKGLRCYAHLGTGNYHPKTAQLYTDLGLLTCDPAVTSDLVNLFNYLTGLAATQSYDTLLVAPFNMRQKFNQLIEREMENARRGLPARIFAKINSMEDRDITDRLYAASNAGVKITLFVRGFCCLKPGVPGLSENIQVISVIGRFLEHSRVFHFGAGSADPLDGDWYISSADWMYRNLSNRVEAAVPVRDTDLRRRLLHILDVMQADRRHAWLLRADGGYDRRVPTGDETDPQLSAAGSFVSLMRETAR
ncbi:MAG: polyphosphate kinase 1 [Phycisphaerales bacterium]